MSDDVLTCMISAPDYETFRTKLAKIAFDFGVTPGADVRLDVVIPADDNVVPQKRRGRPPRSAEVADHNKTVTPIESERAEDDPLADEPTAATQAQPPELTMDDAKDAGRMVLAKKGVDVLKDVLKKFAVTKVADLKYPQFADFIQECSNTERL